jgi:hypothetical protein
LSSPSNLYAEKVYAEQPIALWSLDDDVTFASMFSSTNLNLNNWTTSATVTSLSPTTDPYAQIVNANFIRVVTSGTTTITSPTFSTSSNFSAGVWVNPQAEISSITFTVGSLSKVFSMTGITDSWKYLSHVFEVSSPISSQAFVITITYSGTSSKDIYFNGFSIGKQQNLFGTFNVGNQLQSLPSTLPVSGHGVEAFEYGLGENSGWYIGNNTSKTLFSKNFSMPLVYGANTSTVLYTNSAGPSLIVPGMGFLNESGKKQNLTFEAWLRIKTDGVTQSAPFRIIGPVQSSDGLYVNGQHLILKIGDSFASHYVGEWFRPMLVNIEYSESLARLFVNGEVVATIDLENQVFPDKYSSTIDQDYIGFYVGGNVSFIEIDCVAVYPYRSDPVILKRRFGYGQAVALPSEIETAYSGKQILVDYTFAGYSADYSYPKIESWASSTRDNIGTTKSFMGTPNLAKPAIVLSDTLMSDNTDNSKWESDLTAANIADTSETIPFIKMLPTSDWTDAGVSGYLYFKSLSQPGLGSPSAFYISGKPDASYSDQDQVIFRLQNKETLDSISVILSGTKINYVYNIYGKQGTLKTENLSSTNQKFTVGLSRDTFREYPGRGTEIARFLSGMGRYALFVGGDYAGSDSEISTTFAGKIYAVSMMSPNNFTKQSMASLFPAGFANVSSSTSFMSKSPSYKLNMLKQSFGSDSVYKITVASTSYWQDYIPLQKLAKKAYSSINNNLYSTDMIQFSIDAESSSIIASDKINTSGVDIKTYIYFDYVSSVRSFAVFGNNISQTVITLDKNKVVDASSSWSSKKFEVVDGTVIFPPSSNFTSGKTQADIVMVTLIEITTKSTEFLPVKIRTLEYASQTFNRYTSKTFDKDYAKRIGSRANGSGLYMFSESNNQFDYSSKNPVAISKTMSPYLYNTNRTGIKVLDSYGTSKDRGLLIPVNLDALDSYFISLISFYALYNDDKFESQTSIVEVYDDRYGKLRIVASKFGNDDQNAYLSILNSDGVALTNVEFYINGKYVAKPTISIKEWSSVSILFVSDPIDVSSRSDYKIEIVGSFVINNISYFQIRSEELAQQVLPNEWNDFDTEYLWSQTDTEKTWSQIAASQGFIRPSLSPTTIFDIYSGTNKIYSTQNDDLTGIRLNGYTYDVVEDIIWQTSTTLSP